MNWVTVLWSMSAAACLTLAVVYLLVWLQRRSQWGYLLFSLAAIGTAGLTFFEAWALKAATVEEYGMVLRWGHLPFWIMILSLVGFVRVYLRAGRLWLAWTICGLRTLSLALNFIFSPNINFREITDLRHVRFLGESVSTAVGIPNPWMLTGQISIVLFLVYLVDATITIRRRGERWSMLLLSSGMTLFVATALVQYILSFWGIRPTVLTASPYFLAVVAVMAWKMSRETIMAEQLSDELQQKRNELTHVSRVSMMGQLASTLAHEINQPLGAILRNAEAAELFLQEPSPDLDEVRAILADIRKDDQRAGEVIDRMRGLMKQRKAEYCPLDLNLLMGEVITMVQSDADKRHVRLTLDIDPARPPIKGDRVQLQQVLINLLLNAFDALDDNLPENPLVTVSARSVGDMVEGAVSDNGPGIAAEKMLQIFEPFFSSKPSGLGMGLAISRGIIEAHGGRLWAENNEAGGATFSFSLPVMAGGNL